MSFAAGVYAGLRTGGGGGGSGGDNQRRLFGLKKTDKDGGGGGAQGGTQGASGQGGSANQGIKFDTFRISSLKIIKNLRDEKALKIWMKFESAIFRI